MPRLLFAIAFFALGCASWAAPNYHGPASDHFDGKLFHNYGAGVDDSIAAGVKRELHRPKGRAFWPKWRETPRDVPPRRVAGGTLRVTFVNHASVLIQSDSLNILTDPIWSLHASPLNFYGQVRHAPPGINFEDLPPIDLVLVSHNHYDHMDLETLRRLSRTFHPRILVGLGNGKFLTQRGVTGVEEMDWWQSVQIAPGIRITATPAQHFSARWITDRWRTLWMGFVVSAPSGRIYFAGDTGLGDFVRMVRERFYPFRLVILPIGPGLPRSAMGAQHMSAGDAIEAYRLLGATAALGMHFGTFQQGDETMDEPVETLHRAIEQSGCRINFQALKNGEVLTLGKREKGSGKSKTDCP